jgi:hypothetical protein
MGTVWRLCVRRGCGRRRRSHALEEERYWHLKNVGDLLQSAGPDAVGAFLVFLHLLEGEAECGTQRLLAHCKHHAGLQATSALHAK